MSDLRITPIGRAEIPLKESGKKYRILRVEIFDKGKVTHLGNFSLMDLLGASNAPNGESVVIEEAHLAGHIEP